jgi:hypothetical protein
MGYKFKKVNGRPILCNTSGIKSLKIAFLRKYLQFCNSPNPPTFVYLDDSWIFQNGSQVKSGQVRYPHGISCLVTVGRLFITDSCQITAKSGYSEPVCGYYNILYSSNENFSISSM